MKDVFDYAASADGDPALSYDEYGMAVNVMKKMNDDAKDCEDGYEITMEGCKEAQKPK